MTKTKQTLRVGQWHWLMSFPPRVQAFPTDKLSSGVVIRDLEHTKPIDNTKPVMVFLCKREEFYHPPTRNLVPLWLVGIGEEFLWVDEFCIREQVTSG